jgi:hypothetical protein
VERFNSRHSSNQCKKNRSKWSRNNELTQEREGGEEREEHIKNKRRIWDLSLKHLRGGETLKRMKQNANGGGEGDGGSLILFNKAIT